MFYNLLLIKEKFLRDCSIHRQATSSGIEIDTISKIDFSRQIFRVNFSTIAKWDGGEFSLPLDESF